MAVILIPIGSPSAADVLTAGRFNIVVPQFSRLYDESLKQKTLAAQLRQGVPSMVQIEIVGLDGRTADLRGYGLTTGSSSSSSASAGVWTESVVTGAVRAKIREASEVIRTVYDAEVTVHDADNGLVRVAIPAEVYDVPGIYVMEVGILNADGALIYVYPCYLYIERSSWGDRSSPVGPPLISTLRLSLRDSDLYENLLKDDHGYDTAELCMAAVRTILFWNQRLPPIGSYATTTFPFEHIWIEGIKLYLFQMAEEHYRRNKLPFQAGGTSTNDLDRDKEYKAAWQEMFKLFDTTVMNKKAELNIRRGWLSIRQW